MESGLLTDQLLGERDHHTEKRKGKTTGGPYNEEKPNRFPNDAMSLPWNPITYLCEEYFQ